MDDTIGCRLFGSLRPSSYLEPLPDLAGVTLKAATMKVHGCLKVLEVPEATGYGFYLLNLAVEALTHHIGHRMSEVGQDIGDRPFHSIGVSHADRSAMFELWASLNHGRPIRHVESLWTSSESVDTPIL
jgi:hypothetical protein